MCALPRCGAGWIMLAEYYSNTLYPLQDRVLAAFKGSPFYLTGGTALSRGYYRHRYSDDLDLFVNDHKEFDRLVYGTIDKLRSRFVPLDVVVNEEGFCRLFLGDEQLKVEMINDVPAHVGVVIEHHTLGRLDSRENILANKITALIDRAHPKDVADLYFLLRDGLTIKQALIDASGKAAGVNPLLVASVLEEFDYERLAAVNWIAPIAYVEVRTHLVSIARAIVNGKES